MKKSPLVVFATFYLALFAQFPLTGSLPGNCDTLLSIALTNVFNETVVAFLRGDSLQTIMFPARNFLAYGENCFGLGFIFTFFKLLTGSDHWAYYFFLTTLFTLNSYGIYRLVEPFVNVKSTALVAGFTLPISNYLLANVDDANVIFFFFPAMAIHFFERGLRTGTTRDLRFAALFSGVQIWFGMYVFLFQAIVLMILGVSSLKRLREMLSLREFMLVAAHYLVPSLPLVALYVSNHFEPGLVSPYENPMSRRLSSMRWYHFTNVLPNNLIHSSEANVSHADADASLWYFMRKIAFPGVILPFFAVVGLVSMIRSRTKMTYVLFAIFAVFFAMSFGTNLFDLEGIAALPLGGYFRVASRAHLFALVPVSVFFGVGLNVATKLSGRKWRVAATVVPVLVAAGLIVENVPFPLQRYDYSKTLTPPPSYVKFFESARERSVVADLPSKYEALLPQDGPLWTYSRDALYMNWQTYHRQVIVGGINAYLPSKRIEIDRFFKQLPKVEAIEALRDFGVTHLVFHKKFVLFPEEDVLSGLKAANTLRLELEDDDLAIFSVLRTTP